MKTHLTFTLAIVLGIAITGCGLTPDQIEAIGKSKAATTVCHNAAGFGVQSTTVVTNAGDGKLPGLVQVAPNCATGNARGAGQ